MVRTYKYQVNWKIIPLLFVLALFAYFSVITARNTDSELNFFLIRLSVEGARIFHWAIAILIIAVLILAVFMSIISLCIPHKIVLTDTSITVPRSFWSTDQITVPFSEIIELKMSSLESNQFLEIVHTGGKFTLSSGMLARKEDLDEIYTTVAQGMKTHRAKYRHKATDDKDVFYSS